MEFFLIFFYHGRTIDSGGKRQYTTIASSLYIQRNGNMVNIYLYQFNCNKVLIQQMI